MFHKSGSFNRQSGCRLKVYFSPLFLPRLSLEPESFPQQLAVIPVGGLALPTTLQTVHEFWPFCLRDLEASAPSALPFAHYFKKERLGSLSQNSTGTPTILNRLINLVTLFLNMFKKCTIFNHSAFAVYSVLSRPSIKPTQY